LWGTRGDALRYAQLDWMRVSDFQIHELLARVF
jgi:hypothetical protein